MEVVKLKSWTKWGGARTNLGKEKDEFWNCQVCGEEQSGNCPAYLFKFDDDIYIKVCAKCQNKAVVFKISSFTVLKRLVS